MKNLVPTVTASTGFPGIVCFRSTGGGGGGGGGGYQVQGKLSVL